MNILITSAFQPTEEEKKKLEKAGKLYYLDHDEKLKTTDTGFEPEKINGIVCNYFLKHNHPGLFSELRFVQFTSTGTDKYRFGPEWDGLHIYNAKDVYSIPIAEWAIGRILDFYRHSGYFYEHQNKHEWIKHREIEELYGKRVLLFGYGGIGKQIAVRLAAFGVQITVVRKHPENRDPGIKEMGFAENIGEEISLADIIILALPLTEETEHMINKDFLNQMKKNALLVNAARGKIIDETALIRHLQEGKAGGCILDVFEEEPLQRDSPLWDMDNVLITPHNSFVGNGNHKRLFELIYRNIAGEVM